MEPISLYIHIPFCVKKCAYCDFTSFAGRMGRMEEYALALIAEIETQAAVFGRRQVRTVFFGGGTPTLMTGEQMSRVMEAVRAHFDLLPDAEISIEGNPGTLSPERLCVYRAAGVNRLSLGVQSLDDALLCSVGRIHTAAQAKEAVRMAREAGFDNLNLDLMLGLPGQTAAQWERTLSEALAMKPEHLSCYSLIVEEGTPLAESLEKGSCAALPDEDVLAEMDDVTERLMAQAGFARYEVSNWAKPGRACRHNIAYWECLPYLGLGCAAHSDMDGRRFFNPADFDEYIGIARRGETRREAEGGNTQADRMFERMMMGLRMTRGVALERFARDFGRLPRDVWPEQIARFSQGGLICEAAGRLRLTARGMQVMNGVLSELL